MLIPPRAWSDGSCPSVLTASTPRARALRAVRRKLATESPGIAVGYWKARKSPRRARLSGESFRMSRPFQVTSPFLTR